MAHLLVTALPFAGHARPMTAVAAALLHRNHRVTAYTGATYADAFDELGCEVIVWRDEQEVEHQGAEPLEEDQHSVAHAQRQAARPSARGSQSHLHDLLLSTAMSQVEDILAAHRQRGFDALVGDVMSVGTGLAAELLQLPWATVSLVPLAPPNRDLPPGVHLESNRRVTARLRDRVLRVIAPPATERADRAYRAMRLQLGLDEGRPFLEAIYSPQLVIATGSPLLEPARSDLPARVEFVGQLGPRSPVLGAPPLWVETLAGEPRPIVFATQGLCDTDPEALLEPTLEGLAHDPVRLIATTAGRDVTAEVPANARLVDFVPLSMVLPHAAAGVTNGGWGGVLQMLAAGVPLVVAGCTPDKQGIAARVAWSGAGLDLRTGRPQPIRVRNAVRRLIREPAFRQRAQEIAAEFAALGGAERAAELIEDMLPCQVSSSVS